MDEKVVKLEWASSLDEFIAQLNEIREKVGGDVPVLEYDDEDGWYPAKPLFRVVKVEDYEVKQFNLPAGTDLPIVHVAFFSEGWYEQNGQ